MANIWLIYGEYMVNILLIMVNKWLIYGEYMVNILLIMVNIWLMTVNISSCENILLIYC